MLPVFVCKFNQFFPIMTLIIEKKEPLPFKKFKNRLFESIVMQGGASGGAAFHAPSCRCRINGCNSRFPFSDILNRFPLKCF